MERPSILPFILRVFLSILDGALAVVLAIMLVLFVLGSGSVGALEGFGSQGRWVALLVFWVISLSLAVLSRPIAAVRLPIFALLAVALPMLGLVSSLWSVSPRLSAERAISLGILMTAGLALALAALDRPSLALRSIQGLIAGAALCAVAGFVLVLVNHGDAVQSAGPDSPWRFKGLGANPNTFSMLAALVLPLGAWTTVFARTAIGRVAAGVASLCLFAAVLASGSRGAFAGALGGMLVMAALAPGPMLRRAAHAAGIIAVFACGLVAMQLPAPTGTTSTVVHPSSAHVPKTTPRAHVSPSPTSFFPGRMADEVGRPMTGPRTQARVLLGTSGRAQAWTGAAHQISSRPLLGYGFGTEAKVFVDRFYSFDGGVPENSWLGIALQLGVVGLLLLIAIFVALAESARRFRIFHETAPIPVTALLGAVSAGLLLTVGQSYVYSVGNVATCSFWICALMLGAAMRSEPA